MSEILTFVRKVSFYINPNTGKTRKHVVLPGKISERFGRLCKMIYDPSRPQELVLQFAKAP